MNAKPTKQCEFASLSDTQPRCEKPATRMYGGHWFCEEHGRRDTKPIEPSPTERPTPITDEMLWQYDHLGPNWLATEILGPFARNLERQLAEAREQRDRLANAIINAADVLATTVNQSIISQADAHQTKQKRVPK